MDAVGAPGTERAARPPSSVVRWRRAFLGSLAAMAVLVAVLVVTGLLLAGGYRPTAPAGDLPLDQGLHQLAATLLQAVALLAAVCALGWSHGSGRRLWIGPAVVLALVMVASVTGQRLPWEQLGLWAVTVGTDVEGVWYAAFDDGVRFVLVDGRGELSPADYRQDVLLHLGAGAAVVVGLVVVGLARWRGRSGG